MKRAIGKLALFPRDSPSTRGVIDKRSQNIRSFPCDEPRLEHHPERLAARESRHQGAQDRRARWPPEIAIANRSWRVANGSDRAARWRASARLRVAPHLSSIARRAKRGRGRDLRVNA